MAREWHYLLSQSGVQIADRFLDNLKQTTETLSAMPLTGYACQFSNPKAASIRRFPLRLPFGRWLIFYEPTRQGITIQRILHSARDLQDLFD